MEYRHLMKYDQHEKSWKHSFTNEVGNLSQVVGGVVKATDTIFFIDYENISSERRKYITYGRILVDLCPKKD